MKTIIRIVLILYFALPQILKSQGTSAVPFLLIGPSPQLGGSAGANAVLPTEDAFGFYYNPAQLGNFSQYNNFSFHFYPKRVEWLPQYNFDDLYFRSFALGVGYKVPGYEDYNLTLGLGYMNTHLNLGEIIYTDDAGNELGTFDSKEYYNAFSMGMHFEYYVMINFGITYKYIISKLAPKNILIGTERTNGQADDSAWDLGLQLTIPVIRPDFDDPRNAISFAQSTRPFVDLHFGFAIANIGGKIKYSDSFADPLPRELRTGLGLSIGLEQAYDEITLRWFSLEFGRQANDILVENRNYQSIPGDINYIKHVINGQSDNRVETHTSWRLNLMESLGYAYQRFRGPGYSKFINNTTFHIGTKGIFKYILISSDSMNDSFILKNIDIRYAETKTKDLRGNEGPLDKTKYHGISVTISGLQDLL